MKKLALVSAIAAATLSTGAYAITPHIVTAGYDITATCPPVTTPFAITNVGSTVQLNGEICLEPSGPGAAPFIRLSFNTVTGTYLGASGTTFNIGGSIQVDAQTTSGYAPYSTITVSATNPLDCTTATGITGLQIPVSAPGLTPASAAICDTTLFGLSSQLFLAP
jgi:hypothetical protein